MTWFKFSVPMCSTAYIKVKDMKRFRQEFIYQALITKCGKPDLRVYMTTQVNDFMELWEVSIFKLLPKQTVKGRFIDFKGKEVLNNGYKGNNC